MEAKQITENLISSKSIDMGDIRTFLMKHGINHMPCPLKKGTKDFDFRLRWKAYKRKAQTGKWTWIPKFKEFLTLTNEDYIERHKMYDACDVGVIDTYQILQIDIDAPEYDDWLVELIKTAPYYKSQTKDYGKHIFVKLKQGQCLPKTSDYLEDTKSLKYGDKKIEILNGKWGFFDINRKVYNGDNAIPIIDLNEHPLWKRGYEIMDDSDEDAPVKKEEAERKAPLTPLLLHKLTEYTELIADRKWENFQSWFKIMCAWKNIGATFQDFQKISLTKPGSKSKNREHWDNMKTPHPRWTTLKLYAKQNKPQELLQLDNKYNSFEKFDRWKFMKMTDFKTHQAHQLAKETYDKTLKKIKKLKYKIKDCCSKKETAKLKIELEELEENTEGEKRECKNAQRLFLDATYKKKKEYFERFHFKVMQPISYARKQYIKFNLNNKTEFQQQVAYLKVGRMDKKGELKQEDFFTRWVNDINILEFDEVDFLPPPLEIPEDTYNLYAGLAAEHNMNLYTGKENIQPILDHIKILAGNEKVAKGMDSEPYLLHYLAHMVQKPGEKSKVALTFYGPQGTGKSAFWVCFGKYILGSDYMLQTARRDDLIGNFPQTNHKILVIAEETKTGDTFKGANLFKDLITNDYLMHVKKCKDAFPQRSVLRFIRLTNANNLNVEMNDRRHCIHSPLTSMIVSAAKDEKEAEKRRKHFCDLFAAFEDKATAYAFYKYLKEIPLDNFDIVNDRPLNRSYYDMQSLNIPVYKRFLEFRCRVGNFQELGKDKREEFPFEISARDLYSAFQMWVSSFRPQYTEKISIQAMGRFMGNYDPVEKLPRKEHGTKVMYKIYPDAVRADCKAFEEFLY